MTITDWIIIASVIILIISTLKEWRNDKIPPRLDHRVYRMTLGTDLFIKHMNHDGSMLLEVHGRFCNDWRRGDLLLVRNPASYADLQWRVKGITGVGPIHTVEVGLA